MRACNENFSCTFDLQQIEQEHTGKVKNLFEAARLLEMSDLYLSIRNVRYVSIYLSLSIWLAYCQTSISPSFWFIMFSPQVRQKKSIKTWNTRLSALIIIYMIEFLTNKFLLKYL